MTRADDDLLTHVFTGLRMMVDGFDEALHGPRSDWHSYDARMRRRLPRKDVAPAGPREVVGPLLERLEAFARRQPMGDQTLLSTQDVADLLGLERVSVYNLIVSRHLNETAVGNRRMVSVAELIRYLREGPSSAMHMREDWRPLVDEFPGRKALQERIAVKRAIAEKYDAIFENDARNELDMDWDRFDRYIERSILPSFHVDETGWNLIKRADFEDFKAYLKREVAERAERRRQKQREKQERRRI